MNTIKFFNAVFTLLILSAIISSPLFALNPSTTYAQLPSKFNMVYNEFSVDASDGARLNAWYFPGNVKTTKLILMCHNGEGNMADYMRKVDMFTSHGYNIVIFDYRGFGKSSKFNIDKNMFIYPQFQDDVLSMIRYCSKTYSSNISLYGWGIGAGLALGIGVHHPDVQFIIADTPFLSMEDLEKKFSSWDTPMQVPFAGYDKQNEPIYGLDYKIGKSIRKVLIILGSNDKIMKLDDMKKLQAKAKNLIEDINIVTNPDNIDNFLVDKAAYGNTIFKFLDGKKD
jgi:hypothetical protein